MIKKLNEEVPGRLFHFINLKFKKRLEKNILHLGLTSAHQFGVLILLSKKSMSQKELSQMTLADEPTTSRMLKRMLNNGLISKKRSDDDKRKQVVCLTDTGKEALNNVIPLVQKTNQEIKNMLLDEEYKQLMKILNKINDNL